MTESAVVVITCARTRVPGTSFWKEDVSHERRVEETQYLVGQVFNAG